MAIPPVLAELFQTGVKCWSERLTLSAATLSFLSSLTASLKVSEVLTSMYKNIR